MPAKLPRVSVVVIGRNEERNLGRCFQSVKEMEYPAECLEIIYVDTDSNDKSIGIAEEAGVKVYEEHSNFPTPGLARNRGINAASHDIIHFVDGDMMVDKAYLRKAVRVLGKRNIACVIGRVHELNSQRNFLSKVLHYHWGNRKAGFVQAPGAGGTFLKVVLKEIGGYDPGILKGQETELGNRIRERGYRIFMMDDTMGVHDYGLHDMSDVLHHFYTMGKSYGKILTLPPKVSYSDLTVRARNLLLQGIFFSAVELVLLFVMPKAMVAIIIGLPIIVTFYVILKYRKTYVNRSSVAFFYYLLMHLAKPIVFVGLVSFLIRYSIFGKHL